MRATLSPAFTGKCVHHHLEQFAHAQFSNNSKSLSGSKMRLMFKLMSQVGSQMTSSVCEQINNGANNNVVFRDFAQKFTIDIVATCAFGIEVRKRLF